MSKKKTTTLPTLLPTTQYTKYTMTSSSSLSHTSGTSVGIIVSVSVVLLLFAILLYLFLKWKQNKHDHSSSSHTVNTDDLNNRQLGHTEEDYEEIKDYKFHTDLHTIYNNVDIPTDPSESPTELEHTAEDFDEIKDTKYHPELCSVNTITEAPADPSDQPADPTESHEYNTVIFLENSHCSELETSSSVIQEINE
ncbi:hypothetical protein PHYPO_G00155850 [Pangasianodon hypophthalmus]|uniref:Uncharacterized protein n=1 Tax=Pangasianodon hypophthalmus TaxID=310915 RepID=A0A5N5JWV5_PANHP|nr:hypothetical protein PHYPO_G00155850 [Pangasianodon hypophthalmus]